MSCIAVTSLILALANSSTQAADASAFGDPRIRVDIAAQPLKPALVALVVSGNISIGGVDPDLCLAPPRAVRGTMPAGDALRRLLRDSRCDVHRFDATSFALRLKAGMTPTPLKVAVVPRTTSPDDATATSGDVVVTVVRRPSLLSQVASTIGLIRGYDLAGNDRDLAGVASRVSGLTITNLGPGRDKILLRGVSDSVLTGRTQSTVGLYIDDTPLTYNAPDPDLPLIDMARVEVLKGPQGALYGQGSLSGVVRLVTNKPDLDRFGAAVDVGKGFTEGGHDSTNVSAMLNLPVVAGRLGVRAVAYGDAQGGFITDQINDHKVSNTTRREGGRVAATWRVDDGLTLTGMVLSQNLASSNSQYVMGKKRPYQRFVQVAEPHNNRLNDLSFGAEQQTPYGTLKISLSQVRHAILSGYDAQALLHHALVATSGVLYYEERQRLDLATQDISLISPSDARFRWLLGAFFAQSDERFSPLLTDIFTHQTLYDEDRRDRVHDAAAFGQATYDLTPAWTASAGLRAVYSHHETDSRIRQASIFDFRAAGQLGGTITTRRLAETVAIRYQPVPAQLIYAQYANGYRGGGFNTTTLNTGVDPDSYDGDTLESYELGWRYSGREMKLNLVAFHLDWRNIQSDQLRTTGVPVTVNIGDGVNNGLEFEADWRVHDALDLHAALLLNDPRLTRPTAPFIHDKGESMPYVAKESASLSGTRRTTTGLGTVLTSATLSYHGASPLNYGPLHTVRMDGYGNLDLSSVLVRNHMRYAVRIDNATGVRANSFAYGNPFTVNSSSQVTPLRPRTAWFTVAYQY